MASQSDDEAWAFPQLYIVAVYELLGLFNRNIIGVRLDQRGAAATCLSLIR